MLPRPSTVISRAIPAALLVLILILSITYLYHSPKRIGTSADFVGQHLPGIPAWNSNDDLFSPSPSKKAKPPPPLLPVEYSDDSSDSEFCDDRFSVKYLTHLREASFQYCDASSYSSFTCFHSHTSNNGESDSLCITQGALVDMGVRDDKKFIVNCNVQAPGPNDTAHGVIPFDLVRQYWYDTGPKFILDKHFGFVPRSQLELAKQPNSGGDEESRLFTLLVKREGEGNPWHCLMEIWSMTMTMDLLRTAVDPADPEGQPYFRVPEDVGNLQVVILDDRVDGPYFDLWKLFSGRDPIRLNRITGNPKASEFFNNTKQRLILPLAGATNPVWQNDWTVRDCTRSDTLRAFVRRVLNHYGVHASLASAETDRKKRETVRVTIIDRKNANTRRLANQEALVAALRARYPDTEVQEVDFGTMPFAEQLAIAQNTDVLVGVHGAGLTHTMFLREQSTAVVEIQPSDMDGPYMGFRNLANMRGISYFRTRAMPVEMHFGEATATETSARDLSALSKRASWHTENFEIDTEVFIRAVGAGIQAVYNKNMHSHAIV